MKSGHFLVEGHLFRKSLLSLTHSLSFSLFLFFFFFTNNPSKHPSSLSLSSFIQLYRNTSGGSHHSHTFERNPLPSPSFPLFFLFVKLYTYTSASKKTLSSSLLFHTHTQYESTRNPGSTQHDYHRNLDSEYNHHQLYSLSSAAGRQLCTRPGWCFSLELFSLHSKYSLCIV